MWQDGDALTVQVRCKLLSSGEVEGPSVKHQDADSCVLVVEHVDMLVCPRSTKG